VAGREGSEERDYTPVSSLEAYRAGQLELLVKIYPTGRLTSTLFANLAVGSKLGVSAPEPTLNSQV